jgi:hypothetical protein
MNILEQIVAQKKREVAQRKAEVPVAAAWRSMGFLKSCPIP